MMVGGERKHAMQAALFLLALAALLALATHISQGWHEPMESTLLQQVHSAKYYERLAAADGWMLGPNQREKLHSKARLQVLAEQPSSPLRGMQGVIKACSEGNNRACAAIAQHRTAVKALEDAQPSSQPAIPRPAEPSSTKSVDLSAENGIFDPRNWQSGELDSLGNVASNQWLAACGSGDARACRDIAKSGTALNNLLRASSRPGPPLQSYMKAQAPRAVFVARQPHAAPVQHQGLFSQALSFLGLGDDYDAQKHAAAVRVPKMVPDVGLRRGPKYSAVWNDGTVAPSLSDQPGKRHVDTDSALRLFADNVQLKPPEQKWH